MALISRSAGPPGRCTGRCSCRWGKELGGESEIEDERFAAALAGRPRRGQPAGKAEPGDKTMIDALAPAVECACAAGGRPAPAAADAAPEAGMKATIPMLARKGRASYLGPRSEPPGPRGDLDLSVVAQRRRGAGLRQRHSDQGEGGTRGQVRRSPGPGHHEHTLHDLRPRGQSGQRRAEGARADLSQAGLGRARRQGGLGAHSGGHGRGARRRRRERRRHLPAWASPISARPPWCGTGRPASRSTTRSSGRTRAPTRSSTSCRPTAARTRFREQVGLPLATYFSAPKVRWILDNVDGLAARADSGDLVFGNMDTWVIWNLTGGVDGGQHVTDVTNASRTMLMDLKTLAWDDSIASTIGVPTAMLPEIKASSELLRRGPLRWQASRAWRSPATSAISRRRRSGRPASRPGEAKNTYGTGNFLLLNTGDGGRAVQERAADDRGLQDRRRRRRSTAWRARSPSPAPLIQWLRDNLKLIKAAPEVEDLAKSGRRQRRRATSCRRSRGSSRRTGAPTRAV